MNDSKIKNILKRVKIATYKKKKIEIGFLDKDGAGITEEDELSQKLILTDEEGKDFSKI